MTFHEFAETRFFPFEDLATLTKKNQPSVYKHYVKPRWGNIRLLDITIEDVETWAVVTLASQTLYRSPDRIISASLRKQAYWLFHKIMAKAVERGYVDRSPLPRRSGIKKPQARAPERILDAAQVELLANAAGSWSPVIFSLAYGGFRIGEAFALRTNDLDFGRCQVRVNEKVIEAGGQLVYELDLKRSRSQRIVPVPTTLMEMLAALTMRSGPDDLVFGRVYPNNWRKRVFAKAVTAAGFPHMTPHDLRHTAASMWFAEGFDLVEVARLLGDSLEVAEKTYVHIYEGRRPERMDALDATMRQSRMVGSNVVMLRKAK